MFEGNLMTTLRFSKAILPTMIERRSGSIVNIGSIAGMHPWSGSIAYGAAKAGIMSVNCGNIVYYLIAIPLAYWFKDRRAFCKIVCPVSLVMKVSSKYAKIRKKPSEYECTECGICNHVCLMDIDIMSFISQGKSVASTECIINGTCEIHCPAGAIK